MTIRAKFRCTSETRFAYNEARQLIFQPIYDPQLVEEDVSFSKYTPSGKLEMSVDNPNARFEVGRDYYLDFTPVPDPVGSAPA